MHPTFPPRRRAAGFSLPELLISVAIGLVILAGLSTLFLKNTRTQDEIEKANRQVENGRYAVDLLALDLRNAGYYGEFDPTVLAAPVSLPALCAASLAELNDTLPLAVQGGDGDNTGLDCLDDVRAATDVLVVRRTRSCVAGAAGCADPAGSGPLFQASLCNSATELDSDTRTNHYRLGLSSSGLDRHQRDCTRVAVARRYLTHVYFIANNNQPGDGIPTLKRAELGSDGTSLSYSIVPLAEGIENMQIEYGLDLARDGVPELQVAAPATAAGCAAADCAVANWRSVVAVKLNLLARNAQPSSGFTDTKSYVLGKAANGDPYTIAAARDGYKRHVFQAVVNLPNPAGRRLP
jgi:type IV pilus assembly protein PilW